MKKLILPLSISYVTIVIIILMSMASYKLILIELFGLYTIMILFLYWWLNNPPHIIHNKSAGEIK